MNLLLLLDGFIQSCFELNCKLFRNYIQQLNLLFLAMFVKWLYVTKLLLMSKFWEFQDWYQCMEK
ncbi:unnamed protein product [Paramecium sonneborni]|uniref:Uncharacterized protein n=1 Tax=Paramecium sonneborni TaxID=65129 RepID=A0A8S1MH17_9CILI|nr:unnamed protein product [Paramecium sonneborni]